MDAVDAVVDYRAESRAGRHVLDVAVRSESAGVLHLQLTVSDRAGDVVGEGELRLPPEALMPVERLLGQVLRGLASLHTVQCGPLPSRKRDGSDARDGSPPACRDDGDRQPPPWSEEEHDRLRAAWESGQPVPVIARAHHRSRAAIRSRLLKLGLISLDHPESPVRGEDERP